MPRVSQIVNSLVGGELAPEIQGRTDISKYGAGAKRIENFIVHPEGGAHRRMGTRFVQEAIDSTKKSRLVPFTFSTEQAYILEFSENRIRVYADEAGIANLGRFFVGNSTFVNVTTNEIIFSEGIFGSVAVPDHGFIHNQGPVQFTTTGTLPSGLSVLTDYWVALPKTITFNGFSDVTLATGTIDTTTAHDYVTEMGPFRLTTESSLPAPLQAFTDYYIIVTDATHIQLSLTAGGAAISPFTAAGSGTCTLAPTRDYSRDYLRVADSDGGTPIDITDVGTGLHGISPSPAGSLPIDIATPYAESELYELQFAQSADFLFIAHKNHRPAQLTRTSFLPVYAHTQWALDDMNNVDGPYDAQNTDQAKSITPSATTGHITLTASGFSWADSDIGRQVRLFNTTATSWGYAEVYSITSTTVAQAAVFSAFSATVAETDFQLGSWYTDNWPASVSFFEQRLGFAGEPNSAQTLHGSETNSFNSFSPTEVDGTVIATNAVNFTIASNQVNAIRWLGLGTRLMLGASDAIFSARGSLDGDPITIESINVPRITGYGASAVTPVTIGDQFVYITANHQSLRSFRMELSSDAVTPTDLTLLAKHIFGRTLTVTNMAYQQDRQQVLWCVRSDGVLAAVTYVPEQDVFAWHRHILGGSFNGGDAVVESVAVIPAPDGTHDQLWLSVKRTVNSATVRHIEFLEDEWVDGVDTSMHFIDSAPAAYSGAPATTFSGLDHLEGETVQVLADGADHPDRTVSSGSITLNGSYSDVVAGLGYTSEIESLNFDPPDPEGSSMGKVARVDHVTLRLYQTVGGELGPDASHLDPIITRTAQDPMDESTPAATEDKKVSFEGGFKREKGLLVRQDRPLPFNLLSINIHMSTGQR
jgi:hypothetical protein